MTDDRWNRHPVVILILGIMLVIITYIAFLVDT